MSSQNTRILTTLAMLGAMMSDDIQQHTARKGRASKEGQRRQDTDTAAVPQQPKAPDPHRAAYEAAYATEMQRLKTEAPHLNRKARKRLAAQAARRAAQQAGNPTATEGQQAEGQKPQNEES